MFTFFFFLLRCSLFVFAHDIFSGSAFGNRWDRSRSPFPHIVSNWQNAQKTPSRTSPVRLEVHLWVYRGKFRFKPVPTERKEHLNVSETDSHLRFNKPRSGVTSRVFGRPLFGNACHLFGFPHLLVLLLGLMPSLLCGWKTLWGSLNAHRDPLYEWSVDNVSIVHGAGWKLGGDKPRI